MIYQPWSARRDICRTFTGCLLFLGILGTEAATIQSHPQSKALVEGASAVFTVVAQSATPMVYQWQRGGLDIPGATRAVYTTPPLSLADSGAEFRVRISDASGSVDSDPAFLQVGAGTVIVWRGLDPAGGWNSPTNWSTANVYGVGSDY